ncbi:hypothetical protein VNO77_00903 [Canavalia gladiata]|uniref:Uncharacterized protein n=1 Tax=Canavalia gladiata TaxID=3824 RepID=A0AAN9MQA7_CANGL
MLTSEKGVRHEQKSIIGVLPNSRASWGHMETHHHSYVGSTLKSGTDSPNLHTCNNFASLLSQESYTST